LKLVARAALLAISLISSVDRIAALDPASHISQYGHTVWRVQDGYFGGSPQAITQTKDGYVWVGTEAGLFRFDGVRFVPLSSLSREKLPSSTIFHLFAARDGSLWIGMVGGLAHWANQHLTTYGKEEGWNVGQIMEDQDGRIWFSHEGSGDYSQSLCEVIGSGVRCYGSQDGIPPIGEGALMQDTRGNFWLGGHAAILRWRPGSSHLYPIKPLEADFGASGVNALVAASDGSLWVGIQATGKGLGLQHMVDGALKPYVAPGLNGESIEVFGLLLDRQNTLWVAAADRGIFRIRGTEVDHYGSADGLSADSANDLFEDREGNLWVATSKGIDMFRDLRVSSFSKREGLSGDQVEAVLASRDGTIWIGNSTRVEALGPKGLSDKSNGAPRGNQSTYLLEDHTGRLWAGMDNTLWTREGGKFTQMKKPDGKPFGIVMGMAEDSDHNIWAETIGPPATLIRIRDMKVQEEIPVPKVPLARKIVADPKGGIWLGLMTGDLTRYRAGKVETFHFPDHPKTRVIALTRTPDGSILGATGFGIVAWKDGKTQILSMNNGLPCDGYTGLISDNQENLWLYGECGLVEIAKDEVQRWWDHPESKVKSRVFDELDGVQTGLGHFNTSAKSPDGRLWFANGSILQVVDPAHIAGNTLAPPVYINAVVADRKSYSNQEGITLPPLTRDLEIDYTALGYAVPQKVLFRYRLEGRDAKSQEPGTRRQAFYTDLGPGHYRFHVTACNNDGVWNETGASLNFSIAPAYYQTTWFRLCCVAAFLLLLWAAYLFRVRQLEAHFAAGLETRIDERTRIARELHDTLLQSFQGAVFQFQAARRLLLRNADNAMQVVDEAIQAAEEGITEGRAAIQDMRPEPTAQRDLPELLKATGHELADTHQGNGNAPAFSVVVEGKQRDLSLMFQDEAYRICREVIRNAFAHAGASHIEVEIHYDIDQLRVRIRDDGKGIDRKVLDGGGESGHWGIPGMRERARLIGSRLDFWSEIGAGTEVQLTVPAAMAYAKRSGQRFRLSPRGGSDEQRS
jgi:signal transduction histidine kinase/ligand-binding sensor domain-containing protein